jgi:hypothetical protein
MSNGINYISFFLSGLVYLASFVAFLNFLTLIIAGCNPDTRQQNRFFFRPDLDPPSSPQAGQQSPDQFGSKTPEPTAENVQNISQSN